MTNILNNKTSVSLIAVNLIPLFGVLFLGWNVGLIILLYWSENIIIGISNAFKMKKCVKFATKMEINGKTFDITTNPNDTKKIERFTKSFLIPFFLVHYGIFTLVHGVFVFAFFVRNNISLLGLILSFISIAYSHYISYKTNYIGNEEYKKTNPAKQMFVPYKRILIMHFTILLSGFVVLGLGQPIWALVILIGLKIIFDLILHNKEHTSWVEKYTQNNKSLS